MVCACLDISGWKVTPCTSSMSRCAFTRCACKAEQPCMHGKVRRACLPACLPACLSVPPSVTRLTIGCNLLACCHCTCTEAMCIYQAQGYVASKCRSVPRRLSCPDLVTLPRQALQALCIQHLPIVAKRPSTAVSHHLTADPGHAGLVVLDGLNFTAFDELPPILHLVPQCNRLLIQSVEDSQPVHAAKHQEALQQAVYGVTPFSAALACSVQPKLVGQESLQGAATDSKASQHAYKLHCYWYSSSMTTAQSRTHHHLSLLEIHNPA